jgi:hypothetical protein
VFNTAFTAHGEHAGKDHLVSAKERGYDAEKNNKERSFRGIEA